MNTFQRYAVRILSVLFLFVLVVIYLKVTLSSPQEVQGWFSKDK